ncbi:hypothetical protein HML84_19680 [Alcanivorax sp. IO_7]|nr:hypothetical protein HML84_19680 [Alcanivorax sp. IO_7]
MIKEIPDTSCVIYDIPSKPSSMTERSWSGVT